MLEVKHLKKEYRTKKGAVTRALDDVSLNFPETGMVFILGKSGSGKSTLLNVCGGLDRMDSGEIIIKGKSSNEFSGQDFDSYRNTYVGFVFQEYNILDEFTVEQNIALALELQNKKPDKAAIDKILADVDMTDFASRKPNTLSGGQKQRVAIARALVKEPEIIMADEPTGALDSKTGQQVFDTLKKLSKEKLVLVISHDRDFAEQYGDRIIELKDGKILSDQTRAETDGQQNVKFFGTDTVCVASGSELTDDDLKQIKNFLAKAGGTAVISTSREKIAQFKEDRPEIDVGTFENIKEQPTPKQYEPQKLIRSHLPIKHAIKMGAGSLKTKPVRLVFTIFLSVIAFILFGLASTLMLFDGHSVTVQSFQDSGIDYISMGKVYYVTETSDNYSGENVNNTLFTDEEYDALVKKYSGAIAVISDRESIDNVKLNTMASRFYSSYTNGVVNGDDKLTYVAGRKPQALDEVAISEFMFDGFKSSGTRFLNGVDNTEVELRTAADILSTDSKPITLKSDDIQLKIVGVFKSMQVPADFKTLKEAADNNDTSANIGFSEYTWSVEMENGFYNVIAVSPEMYALVKDEVLNGEKNIDYSYYFKYSESSITMGYSLKQYEAEDNWNTYSCSSFNTYGEKALKLYGLDGKEKNTVGNGEIAISYKALASVLYNKWWEFRDALNNDEEYQTMISKKWDEVRNAYDETHEPPDISIYLDSEGYDKDVAQWNDDFNAYLDTIDGDYNYWDVRDQYENEHPYPDREDYYDKDAMREAIDKYNAERDEYINNEVNKFRKDVPYQKALVQLRKEAEEKYLAENPEPSRDDDAHQQWWYGLEAAINNVDPFNDLNRLQNGNVALSEIQNVIATAANLLKEMNVDVDKMYVWNNVSDAVEVKIAGYLNMSSYWYCYLGADLYNQFYVKPPYYDNSSSSTKYEEPEDAYIGRILIPYDGSKSLIESLIKISETRNNDDSGAMIMNTIYSELNMIIDMASTLELGFIIAACVLALFAFLLMFNFISASITAKKKEIGILRAIGARTTDVFKIFVSEALIIAIICFAIATAGSFGLCILLNSILLEDVGLSISLFVFGPLSVLFILGVALLTALISTIIPVSIYSRKPPIDSIRAL